MGASLIERVRERLEYHQMVNSGDRVLVACSGGPDSIFLVHALQALSPQAGIDLHVAHLNHRMRGEESQADADFVGEFVRSRGIGFTIESQDVLRQIEESGLSPEACARNIRYQFLDRVADQVGAQRIATGHTADDQAETFLLRLFRGAGTLGLASIPPVRGRIIRPLIGLHRDEIEAFLHSQGIPFRKDSTNTIVPPLRNAVRMELIPWLSRHLNPRAVDLLGRTTDILRVDEDYLSQQAQRALADVLMEESGGRVVLRRPELLSYHTALQRRVVRLAIARVTGSWYPIHFIDVDAVLRIARVVRGSQMVDLSQGRVRREYDRLIIEEKDYPAPPPIGPMELPLPGVAHVSHYGMTIVTEMVSPSSISWNHGRLDSREIYLDPSSVSLPLVVRSRRPGDRLTPFGSTVVRKVKDVLIDAKIPAARRDGVPILTDQQRVIWVVGVVRSEVARITEQTRTAIHVVVDW